MVIITLLLLAVLIVAGLFNIFFHFPTKKFYAWLQYISANKSSSPMISTASKPPAPSHEERTTAHGKPELKKIFATFDKNGDGFIAKQELRESLKNIRILMTDKEVEEMVVKVDANGDGLIDFDEFCVLCDTIVGQKGENEGDEAAKGLENEGGGEEDLKEAFGVFDKDSDGLITVEELGLVLCSLGLKEGKKVDDCKEMIRKVDMDGDGMVNFDEFKKMMKGGRGRLLFA